MVHTGRLDQRPGTGIHDVRWRGNAQIDLGIGTMKRDKFGLAPCHAFDASFQLEFVFHNQVTTHQRKTGKVGFLQQQCVQRRQIDGALHQGQGRKVLEGS